MKGLCHESLYIFLPIIYSFSICSWGQKYNILIEFWVPMRKDRMIKMCLNEIYSEVRVDKYMSDKFPIQNGLKKEML
jgi:hypothetical protein